MIKSFSTSPDWVSLRDVVHPALATDLPGTPRQRALLLRDILRSRVGQLGENGSIFIGSEENIHSAFSGKGQLSTSCGPIAYLYARLAQEFGIKATVVSILWDKPGVEHGKMAGHTLNEISDGSRRWLIDCHTGNVWQTDSNQLASATDMARSLLQPVNTWSIHPSSHGQSAASWLYGSLRYVFGFWGFDIDAKPPPARVAVITHRIRNQASMPAHTMRWYSLSDAVDTTVTGMGVDLSSARFFWNGQPVASSKRPL